METDGSSEADGDDPATGLPQRCPSSEADEDYVPGVECMSHRMQTLVANRLRQRLMRTAWDTVDMLSSSLHCKFPNVSPFVFYSSQDRGRSGSGETTLRTKAIP